MKKNIVNLNLIALLLLIGFPFVIVKAQSTNVLNIPIESSQRKINRLAVDQLKDETIVSIDGATNISIEIVSNIENIETSIISPSGQIINQQNVESFGGKFLQTKSSAPSVNDTLILIPQLSGNYHYIYNLPNLGEGDYKIVFQAPAGINKEVPIITEVRWDSEINTQLFVTETSVSVGKPVNLIAAVFKNLLPVSDASVEVFIKQPNGKRITLELLDNGNSQTDDKSGDGLYSASYTPSMVGIHSLVAFITGKIPEANELSTIKNFSRNSIARIEVTNPVSQFTGKISDNGVDDNADGLLDRIEFRMATQTTVSGNYQAFVELKTKTGQVLIGNGVANLNNGFGEIIANVPASVIREANENGPYTIEKIRLDKVSESEGSQEVDRRINLGKTMPYQVDQFQRPPLLLTGEFSEMGIDTNGNGKFDILRVTVQVDVLTAGFYEWNMKLATQDFQDINFASANGDLTSGLNNITLDFLGARLRRSEIDGPYEIRDLLLFGPNSLVTTEIGSTRFYKFTDFEDGGPNVSINLTPENASNLRIGQTHTLTVNVNQNSTPIASRIVTFRVLSGPNAGILQSKTTDSNGRATFDYTGMEVGTDNLRASVSVDDFVFNSNNATAVWTDNSAPVCTSASPSISLISPPDNRFVPIHITGFTDSDNDPLTVSVFSIMQDEPTNHLGTSQNTADASIKNGVASIKAERIFGTVRVGGNTYVGNGRVYHISYVVSDGRGGQCNGTVKVGVPHVRTATPIDDGSLFDSTIP